MIQSILPINRDQSSAAACAASRFIVRGFQYILSGWQAIDIAVAPHNKVLSRVLQVCRGGAGGLNSPAALEIRRSQDSHLPCTHWFFRHSNSQAAISSGTSLIHDPLNRRQSWRSDRNAGFVSWGIGQSQIDTGADSLHQKWQNGDGKMATTASVPS